MALVMASKSPRRRELMAMVTEAFMVDEAMVDERAVAAASPTALASELAYQKAMEVASRRPVDTVIGCDTVVEIDGIDLEKPENADEATRMLGRLSGRQHQVHTAITIVQPGGKTHSYVETSLVFMEPLPPEEVRAYVATDEAYDKAGGYAIQGWAARYIYRIEGCYYNIMGLPVASLHKKLVSLGLL